MKKNSYSNPFSGVNAGQLDVDSIIEYWCNPFIYDLFAEIKQEDIYNEEMNIVFMGGRSTGKSMFLRYWSYQVQFKLTEKIFDSLKANNGIGFYFRIDGPILRSFQKNGLSEEKWSSIFTHYFELIVGREYLIALNILLEKGELTEQDLGVEFMVSLKKLLGIENSNSLLEIIKQLDNKISEVDLYRGNVAFSNEEFDPKGRAFPSESLCYGVAELILTNIKGFERFNIIILLDEYENFLEYQQLIINTLLRSSRPSIKFRIGMRQEGFRTFYMISDDDFIKEGREYRKVVFDEVLTKDSDYQAFLIAVCEKRLESVKVFKENNFLKIKNFLGDKENPEIEALELVKNNPNKLFDFFSKKLSKIPKEDLKRIQNPENPLLELLNYIWLLRGNSLEKTKKAMEDFLNNIKNDESKKYRSDYINKYKLSLTFLLCSIYRKDKKFYSFNTFAFLSSGIIGHFIELCRRSFALAEWGDNDKLINEGVISKELQSKAAIDFSMDELEQVSRIELYGGLISKFVENIGNIFRAFHKDYKLRYPETNQFSMHINSITDKELELALKTAIKWSSIQKKPSLQRSAPSETYKDLYTINRIFSPSFKISYRTRGGKSVLLNEAKLNELFTSDKINLGHYLPEEEIKIEDPNLFDNHE